MARAVFYPYHIKAGKLKPAAFRAKAGRQDVSVNRVLVLGTHACKSHARDIATSGDYLGFAVLSARIVRQCGSDVKDSREQYLGHADIIHNVVLEKDEPAPPEFNKLLKCLVVGARFFPDPTPDDDRWTGEDFSVTPQA